MRSHVNIKYVIHFSIHGLHAHALSGTNGVGQASNSPSHPSRSNDNSRVTLLVYDEHLLAFLDYLEGYGVLDLTADRGRRRHTRDAAEARMSPGESALAGPGDKYVVSRSQPVFRAGYARLGDEVNAARCIFLRLQILYTTHSSIYDSSIRGAIIRFFPPFYVQIDVVWKMEEGSGLGTRDYTWCSVTPSFIGYFQYSCVGHSPTSIHASEVHQNWLQRWKRVVVVPENYSTSRVMKGIIAN